MNREVYYSRIVTTSQVIINRQVITPHFNFLHPNRSLPALFQHSHTLSPFQPPPPAGFPCKSAPRSNCEAGARGLRLRRSHVHRLGADDRRGAPVNTEQSAGRPAVGADVGDAQGVVCEGFSNSDLHDIYPGGGNLFVGFGTGTVRRGGVGKGRRGGGGGVWKMGSGIRTDVED